MTYQVSHKFLILYFLEMVSFFQCPPLCHLCPISLLIIDQGVLEKVCFAEGDMAVVPHF